MPEHCHLLIWPRRSPYSISTILRAIKLPVARRAVSWIKKHCPGKLSLMRDEQPGGEVAHRFWQRGGGFDQNLIDEHLVYATIDYLHLNPVRRGLVDQAVEWRWSSAGYYAGQLDVPLVPDFKSLPAIDETR